MTFFLIKSTCRSNAKSAFEAWPKVTVRMLQFNSSKVKFFSSGMRASFNCRQHNFCYWLDKWIISHHCSACRHEFFFCYALTYTIYELIILYFFFHFKFSNPAISRNLYEFLKVEPCFENHSNLYFQIIRDLFRDQLLF